MQKDQVLFNEVHLLNETVMPVTTCNRKIEQYAGYIVSSQTMNLSQLKNGQISFTCLKTSNKNELS